eukprot:6215986-Prymnesium_polylepis.1
MVLAHLPERYPESFSFDAEAQRVSVHVRATAGGDAVEPVVDSYDVREWRERAPLELAGLLLQEDLVLIEAEVCLRSGFKQFLRARSRLTGARIPVRTAFGRAPRAGGVRRLLLWPRAGARGDGPRADPPERAALRAGPQEARRPLLWQAHGAGARVADQLWDDVVRQP